VSDFSALNQFRPAAKVTESDETPPKSFRWTGNGVIVAFDQSLANSGYVVAEVAQKRLSVMASGTIHTVTTGGRKSWTDTLYRARELIEPMGAVLAEYQPVLIIHEMPPIGNSRSMRRPDSSILSSLALWVAAGETPIRMVDARAAKKYLTGKPGATKKEVRTALEKRLGDVFQAPDLRKNEHTYDALALLITFIHKESK